jgi:hypothetical protein
MAPTIDLPGVGQGTPSRQDWQFLVPQLRQWDTWEYDTDRQNEWAIVFSTHKMTWDVWAMLARPLIPPSTAYGTSRPQTHPESSLAILSTELFDTIITYLMPSPNDLMAFSLTTSRLWILVIRHIHKQYLHLSAPWAGAKLALQGSYSADLPPPFLEPSVLHLIIPPNKRWRERRYVARRFFRVHENFDEPVGPNSLHRDYLKAMRKFKEESGISEARWGTMEAELGYEELFPKDRVWVLRNLTTREIVTTERRFRESVPTSDSFRLDELLLLKICWTSIPSEGDRTLGVGRGSWSGHAFEILCMEAHEREGGVWRDVTEEVEAEASEVRRKAIVSMSEQPV